LLKESKIVKEQESPIFLLDCKKELDPDIDSGFDD